MRQAGTPPPKSRGSKRQAFPSGLLLGGLRLPSVACASLTSQPEGRTGCAQAVPLSAGAKPCRNPVGACACRGPSAPGGGFASCTLQGPCAPYRGLALCLSLTPRPVWPPGEEVRTGHPTASPQPLGGQGSMGGTWPALCPPQMGGFTCLAFTEGRSHNQGLRPLRTDDSTRNSSGLCPRKAAPPVAVRPGREACGLCSGRRAPRWGGQRQGQRRTETDRDRDRDRDRAIQGQRRTETGCSAGSSSLSGFASIFQSFLPPRGKPVSTASFATLREQP